MPNSINPTNNISGFVNAFAGGGVRTNLFNVTGTVPVPGYNNNQTISFMVKAAQIPASSLGTIEVPYRGRRIKIPGDRTFADWSITVLSDSNLGLRSAFETWSALFNSHVGNITDRNQYQYMTNWNITPMYRDGDGIRTYTMIGCFPTEVGAIDFSYENNDAVAEFPVTMNFSWWVVNPGAAPAASGNTDSAMIQPITPQGTGFAVGNGGGSLPLGNNG